MLLQEAYDDMSEGKYPLHELDCITLARCFNNHLEFFGLTFSVSGEQRLNASFLGGISSSDDATNSDFYDPRQSPPKAIVDSSPLQPQMDKNKECKF